MTENDNLTYVKIEAKGFQDICNKLAELEKQNKELILEAHETVKELEEKIDELTIDNDFLQRQNNALKMRCSNYCLQVRDLESEIADMKFTRKYLTSEEAGKAFARELLGKPMTEEELAIEAAENAYIPYVGDDF